MRKLLLQLTFILFAMSCANACLSNINGGFNAFLTLKADNNEPIRTIVIDAGHGGKDSGCLGEHSQEKHIALDIALLLGNKIRRNFPEIKVIYTRTEDVFIPLNLRAKVANKNNADLFISIHCNAYKKSNVRGTETYVMGLHRAKENLAIAKRENASILLEDNYEESYDFDPESPEGHILLSMHQNTNLDNSIAIAAEIEEEFSKSALSKSRGVKQAGFVVLRKATMPSILVETGYLTNSQDEAFLRTDDGKNQIVDSIIRGLDNYINTKKNNALAVVESNTIHQSSFRDQDPTEDKRKTHSSTQQKSLSTRIQQAQKKTPKKKSIQKSYDAPVRQHAKPHYKKPATPPSQSDGIYTHQVNKNNSYQAPQQYNTATNTSAVNRSNPYVRSYKKKKLEKVYYSIQIGSTRELCNPLKTLNIDDVPFRYFYEEGVYKYISGHFSNMPDAIHYKQQLDKKGIKGAFLIKYDDNIKQNIEKAREIAKEQ